MPEDRILDTPWQGLTLNVLKPENLVSGVFRDGQSEYPIGEITVTLSDNSARLSTTCTVAEAYLKSHGIMPDYPNAPFQGLNLQAQERRKSPTFTGTKRESEIRFQRLP
ncbi:hypothetical protein TNCV_359441 [Trichonephila clavipes]|nr:hypothetical protein TNCV_359441 [Trichonephila clavipes]